MTGDKTDPWEHWENLCSILEEQRLPLKTKGPTMYVNPESSSGYQLLASALVFDSLASARGGERCIGTSYFRMAKFILMRPSLLPEFRHFARQKRDRRQSNWTVRPPRGYSTDQYHSRAMRYLLAAEIFRATDRLIYEYKNIERLDALTSWAKEAQLFRSHRTILCELRALGEGGLET